MCFPQIIVVGLSERNKFLNFFLNPRRHWENFRQVAEKTGKPAHRVRNSAPRPGEVIGKTKSLVWAAPHYSESGGARRFPKGVLDGGFSFREVDTASIY